MLRRDSIVSLAAHEALQASDNAAHMQRMAVMGKAWQHRRPSKASARRSKPLPTTGKKASAAMTRLEVEMTSPVLQTVNNHRNGQRKRHQRSIPDRLATKSVVAAPQGCTTRAVTPNQRSSQPARLAKLLGYIPDTCRSNEKHSPQRSSMGVEEDEEGIRAHPTPRMAVCGGRRDSEVVNVRRSGVDAMMTTMPAEKIRDQAIIQGVVDCVECDPVWACEEVKHGNTSAALDKHTKRPMIASLKRHRQRQQNQGLNHPCLLDGGGSETTFLLYRCFLFYVTLAAKTVIRRVTGMNRWDSKLNEATTGIARHAHPDVDASLTLPAPYFALMLGDCMLLQERYRATSLAATANASIRLLDCATVHAIVANIVCPQDRNQPKAGREPFAALPLSLTFAQFLGALVATARYAFVPQQPCCQLAGPCEQQAVFSQSAVDKACRSSPSQRRPACQRQAQQQDHDDMICGAHAATSSPKSCTSRNTFDKWWEQTASAFWKMISEWVAPRCSQLVLAHSHLDSEFGELCLRHTRALFVHFDPFVSLLFDLYASSSQQLCKKSRRDKDEVCEDECAPQQVFTYVACLRMYRDLRLSTFGVTVCDVARMFAVTALEVRTSSIHVAKSMMTLHCVSYFRILLCRIAMVPACKLRNASTASLVMVRQVKALFAHIAQRHSYDNVLRAPALTLSGPTAVPRSRHHLIMKALSSLRTCFRVMWEAEGHPNYLAASGIYNDDAGDGSHNDSACGSRGEHKQRLEKGDNPQRFMSLLVYGGTWQRRSKSPSISAISRGLRSAAFRDNQRLLSSLKHCTCSVKNEPNVSCCSSSSCSVASPARSATESTVSSSSCVWSVVDAAVYLVSTRSPNVSSLGASTPPPVDVLRSSLALRLPGPLLACDRRMIEADQSSSEAVGRHRKLSLSRDDPIATPATTDMHRSSASATNTASVHARVEPKAAGTAPPATRRGNVCPRRDTQIRSRTAPRDIIRHATIGATAGANITRVSQHAVVSSAVSYASPSTQFVKQSLNFVTDSFTPALPTAAAESLSQSPCELLSSPRVHIVPSGTQVDEDDDKEEQDRLAKARIRWESRRPRSTGASRTPVTGKGTSLHDRVDVVVDGAEDDSDDYDADELLDHATGNFASAACLRDEAGDSIEERKTARQHMQSSVGEYGKGAHGTPPVKQRTPVLPSPSNETMLMQNASSFDIQVAAPLSPDVSMELSTDVAVIAPSKPTASMGMRKELRVPKQCARTCVGERHNKGFQSDRVLLKRGQQHQRRFVRRLAEGTGKVQGGGAAMAIVRATVMRGSLVMKFPARGMSAFRRPHMRFIRISETEDSILWIDASKATNGNLALANAHRLALAQVTHVRLGAKMHAFSGLTSYEVKSLDLESRAFSICTMKRSLDVVADSATTRNAWVAYLRVGLVRRARALVRSGGVV